MNPITGEGKVTIAGQDYTIKFDWSCLAAVEAEFGDNPNFFDPNIVASIAAIGMKKYHPEMTMERIKELSPPLIPFANQVHLAMKYAYFGNSKEKQDDKPEDVKKNDRKRGGLWQHIKRLLGMG